MKPALVLPVFAALTLAADIAQLLQQLPACSPKCLVEGAGEHNCSVVDYECQCSKLEAITATVSPCLVNAGCQLGDIGKVAETFSAICVEVAAKNGANPSVPGDAASTAPAPANTNVPAAAARSLSAAWSGAAAIAVVAAVL
ncbi:hypothetical protein HJFPF1_03928 [Paramyrothecium foliicola]|nr:hypothetical protein HJFPF1_03928 [Paramyrothecium foliicola]